MKVALKKEVAKLGQPGDIKNVADGYARNFLIPHGLAEIATAAVIKRTEKIRQERALTEAKQKVELGKVAQSIAGKKILLQAKAKKGKLFGSITTAQIAEAITKQTQVLIDKKLIVLAEPIKEIGEYVVPVKFKEEVATELVIKVTAE